MSDPRPPRGEARREHILEAALRVVGEVGPEGLTHRRVAAEAGLPTAATTYWFASKDALLEQAYALEAGRDIARIQALADAELAQLAPEQLAARLTTLIGDELARSRTAIVGSYALWVEAARRPALRRVAAEWTDAYVDIVHRALGAVGGQPQPEDARLLVAAMDGLVLDALGREDPGPIGPALERLLAALMA